MPIFCLTKQTKQDFKEALKSGEINPVKLAEMKSVERRNYLSKYVGKENAPKVNALFESKLLLKNKKAGYIAWAKSISGISKETKRDLLTKIERLQKVLDPKEEEAFLQDLVNTRLNLEVTEEEAKTISDLSKKIQELQAKADENGVFDNKNDRIDYGVTKVAIENYINDIKLNVKESSKTRADKIKSFIADFPGAVKSTVASLDNSLWGRQGIKTLLDPVTSKIWARNFIKSWGDIGKQITAKGKWYKTGDDAALNAIKADIYSRPNAVNGKYKAGGYGLDVLSEEAYPSSLPEKIPVLGRLFKASEAAYNGGALRLRADLADRMIKIGEQNGLDMSNRKDAEGMGALVSSMTGRGSLGKADVIAKELNTLLFSVKFLKSNIDTLTAGFTNTKIRQNPVARKEAAQSLLRMIGTVSLVTLLAGLFDPDSVDPDPRSTNFGKIKIFGKWVDITGGMAGLIRLAAYITPSVHDGKLSLWKKSSSGTWTDLRANEYGKQNAFDLLLDGLISNKLSPAAGLFRDAIKGQFFGGEKFTAKGAVQQLITPLSIKSFKDMEKDPTTQFILGSMLLEGLGFSTSTIPESNDKSNIIPVGEEISTDNFLETVLIYGNAIGTDPETAFNRIFTGQRIRKVRGDAVIVERIPVSESQKIKAAANAKNPLMKLDHTIPLELGGSNEKDNLKIVSTAQWSSYTKVENALAKALESKKINRKQAQELIVEFKKIENDNARKKRAEQIINDYK